MAPDECVKVLAASCHVQIGTRIANGGLDLGAGADDVSIIHQRIDREALGAHQFWHSLLVGLVAVDEDLTK